MKKTPEFIGLDTHYVNANGDEIRRRHFDGAASPLASKKALTTFQSLLPHYSNTHSHVHSSAQIMTKAFEAAQQTILSVLGADPSEYCVIFTGSGTTAGINRLVRGLHGYRADKNVALVSAMEHHANDLPHRQFDQQVEYIPLAEPIAGTDKDATCSGAYPGAIDLDAMEQLLKQHKGKVNYVSVSSISNVTGIRNPVCRAASLAHQYDALIMVDAAQAIAHHDISSYFSTKQDDEQGSIDFVVFSGHKVYAPATPGVVVAKRKMLEKMSGQDLGGGAVTTVSYYDYELSSNLSDKEQAGTPNILGAISLAAVLRELSDYGFDGIEQHVSDLMSQLLEGLKKIENITVYGDPDEDRIGAVSFNHEKIDHGLLAAILNDYYGLAVRNECFCAHPYVSDMLKETLWALNIDDIEESQLQAYINRKRGMVRVSLSLYNTAEDVAYLLDCLATIASTVSEYNDLYEPLEDGSYVHKHYRLGWQQYVQELFSANS